jgi:DNA-binding transcriptional MocR family regulator
LAEEFDFSIVEDDTHGELVGTGAAQRGIRVAALDQFQRVVFVGSYSKVLPIGMRVAYVTSTPARMDMIGGVRAINCFAANSLGERAVYRLIDEGHLRRHAEELRHRLVDARSRTAALLQDCGVSVSTMPLAGMFLWADLGPGLDALAVSEAMLAKGHLLAPGPLFSDHSASFMRLNAASFEHGAMFDELRRTLDHFRRLSAAR